MAYKKKREQLANDGAKQKVFRTKLGRVRFVLHFVLRCSLNIRCNNNVVLILFYYYFLAEERKTLTVKKSQSTQCC